MFTITMLSFRETLEIALIIIPLLAYITRLERKDLAKYIYLGSLTGIILSVIAGVLLYSGVNELQGFSKNLFEGSMSFFLCALIIYSVVWLGRQSKNFSKSIDEKFKFQTTGISLFLLALLSIFRELLELLLFTLPLNDLGYGKIIASILGGILITLILTFVIYKSSLKLNINLIFSFITLFLIYIGATMFGEGLITLFPKYGESLEIPGMMIFGIPLLYFFIKNQINIYTKK